MFTKNYTILLLIFLIIIQLANSDVNCIINGLEANSCSLTNPNNMTYEFTTTNTTIIEGFFEIPLHTRLNFQGPVEFANYSTIKFNCKSNLTEDECTQIYSEQIVFYYATRYLVNLDVSQVPIQSGDYFQFGRVNLQSTYPNQNLLNFYPLPLFNVNITSKPADLQVSYHSEESFFHFFLNNRQISKTLDINITHNCDVFEDSLRYDIYTNLDIPPNYFYTFSEEPGYFYIKINPYFSDFEVDVNKVLLLIANKNYIANSCQLFGGKQLEYHAYIIDSITGEIQSEYLEPTPTPTTTTTTTTTSTSETQQESSETPSNATNLFVNSFIITLIFLITLITYVL